MLDASDPMDVSFFNCEGLAENALLMKSFIVLEFRSHWKLVNQFAIEFANSVPWSATSLAASSTSFHALEVNLPVLSTAFFPHFEAALYCFESLIVFTESSQVFFVASAAVSATLVTVFAASVAVLVTALVAESTHDPFFLRRRPHCAFDFATVESSMESRRSSPTAFLAPSAGSSWRKSSPARGFSGTTKSVV